jgi:hypothetical protein
MAEATKVVRLLNLIDVFGSIDVFTTFFWLLLFLSLFLIHEVTAC